MDLKPPQSIGVYHDKVLESATTFGCTMPDYVYTYLVFFQELHGVPQSSGKILWDLWRPALYLPSGRRVDGAEFIVPKSRGSACTYNVDLRFIN